MKLFAEKRTQPKIGSVGQKVLWRGRLMVRIGWTPYRGLLIGERGDPSDLIRVLVYRLHVVVSWLPYSKRGRR